MEGNIIQGRDTTEGSGILYGLCAIGGAWKRRGQDHVATIRSKETKVLTDQFGAPGKQDFILELKEGVPRLKVLPFLRTIEWNGLVSKELQSMLVP